MGYCINYNVKAMPKKKGKGSRGKNRKSAKYKPAIQTRRDIRYKMDLEEYAQVKKVPGGNFIIAQCFDGKERRCRIPGSFRRRVWLKKGDLILVSLREYEDTADVIHKYKADEKLNLIRMEEIPADDDDNFQVEFDICGELCGHLRPDIQDYNHITSKRKLMSKELEDVEFDESLKGAGVDKGPAS